ncbi:MAG: hypothetical protein ABRQ39_03020 [Candidatus Eremiobacterota bacterium]
MIYGLIALCILILTAISLLISYIRANMFFVFMESLIQRHVSIMRSFTGNKNKGFSLFLFNIVVGIVFFALTIIIFIPLLLHLWHIINNPKADFAIWAIIPNFILSFVAFIILAIISMIIYSLTYDFACPISYARDTGIAGSICFLMRLILNYPFQFFIYYVLKIAFAAANAFLSIILFILVLIVLAVVYIPLILIAVGIGIAIVFLFMKNAVIGIIAGIIGGLLIFCIMMAVSYIFLVPFIPIHTFFRFYALCFLENFPETGLDFSECYREDFVGQ